jgi:hypothetical protein
VDLPVPLRNAPRPAVLGLGDDVVEVVTDRVHQHLAVQVKGDIVGLAASTDLSNDWKSEGVVPGLVLVAQITEIPPHVCVCSCRTFKILNLFLHMRFSFRVGLQELPVACGLVAAQAGFLIHNQLRYQGCLGDTGVRVLNQVDGRVGIPDLEVESAGDHQQGRHRQQKYLSQNAIELL